jgi:hypothetical protein
MYVYGITGAIAAIGDVMLSRLDSTWMEGSCLESETRVLGFGELS